MSTEQQKTIAGYWQQVAEQTGADFNFDFWVKCEPRRSTYPACRAMLARGEQLTPIEINYQNMEPALATILG